MRRIGILLALMIVSLLSLPALPALAKTKPSGAEARPKVREETHVLSSGKGMNREGTASMHPGKGWSDHDGIQGSAKNHADPDCTGNRTVGPQLTNNGACDDAMGAADKPGGPGGFDNDRDFNNGCGNDTDFEDDNNGNCGGKHLASGTNENEPKKHEKPARVHKPRHVNKKKVVESPVNPTVAQPVVVLGEKIRAGQPLSAPATLPTTGIDLDSMMLGAVAMITAGRLLLKAGKSRKRAGLYRLFPFMGHWFRLSWMYR